MMQITQPKKDVRLGTKDGHGLKLSLHGAATPANMSSPLYEQVFGQTHWTDQ